LELGRGGKVVAGNDQERGEIDAGVFVGLHFEAAAVPMYGLVQHFFVVVAGFDELVLANPAAQANYVRYFVFLFFESLRNDLVRLFSVAFFVTSAKNREKYAFSTLDRNVDYFQKLKIRLPVQSESVQKDDGWIL